MSTQKRQVEPVAGTSADLVKEQADRLREIYPECVTEGKVDFEKLKATLGEIVDDRPERYSFTWAGKRDAIRLLQTPSRATLVPVPEESVDFETTQNLFVEGDNLEVLKLLYRAYAGRVKMIYIDPPYNTGNDFIYPDNFADPLQTYLRLTGQKDEAGNLLTSNPETSGRYHSAWLSMMYPRLFLARQLLRKDGVIFVSIDDHEVHNLRMVMNEIFGEESFVATFVWEKRTTRENRRVFSFNHDFVICYARNKDLFQSTRRLLPFTEDTRKRYTNPDNDRRGDWQSVSLNAQAGHGTPAQFYTIVTPSGRRLPPPSGTCWRVTERRLKELIADNRIWFGPQGSNVPRMKVFLSESSEGLTPHTLWKADEVGTTDTAKKSLMDLFDGQAVFETPKPVELLRGIVQISTRASDEDIILDFFAGSCPMAQGVLEINREDGGDRRFIMVQLPEQMGANSRAYNESGDSCVEAITVREPVAESYGVIGDVGGGSAEAIHALDSSRVTSTGRFTLTSIVDIGKERIRRVINRLKKETEGNLDFKTGDQPEDLGFRVFKLAESHYRRWAGVAERDPKTAAHEMGLFNEPLNPGWEPVNVIYEVAIKEGYSLTSRIEKLPPKNVKPNTVYRVTDDHTGQSFLICLDDKLKTGTLEAPELGKEAIFVCRDSALDDDSAANLALQCRLKTI